MNIIKKRRKSRLVLSISLVLVAFLCILSVNADFGTHLNVTIVEKVYQETSFAENYTLTEWQKSCYSEGTINISNPENETVYDIFISFKNTGNLLTNLTWDNTTKDGNQTSGIPGTLIIINIPELRQGNYSTFTYNISCLGQDPSINIETSYSNFDHGFNNKVLSGFNWTLNQTARNDNPINATVEDINITITVNTVTWNASQFSFGLASLYSDAQSDYTNVSQVSSSTWWWAPKGGTISWNDSAWIRYNVTAPYSVPFTATYLAITETIESTVNDNLLSNLTIVDINGTARVDMDFEKRISQPSDNVENHNVTWEIRPYITVPVNITYDLSKVTLWVTLNMDPTNDTNGTQWGLLEKVHSGSPLKQINLSTSWGNSTYYWNFNYTDGANATYPPPIVWMKPEYLLAHKYAQIVNYSSSVSGNDTYLKYIYVVAGYWLEVTKNVTNIEEDQYQINIEVENIGNGWTPRYEKVTVYDFVPNEFSVWNMSPAAYSCALGGTGCLNLSIGSPGDDYYGRSYRWDIAWKGDMNSSLGPKNGPDATGPANYSWSLSYKVNGTGPYRVSELYIVGLDPLKVDGAFTSPIITIISGIQTYTNEIIYLSVIIFLIIVNISNLVITRRIHKKIQQRMPEAPRKDNKFD